MPVTFDAPSNSGRVTFDPPESGGGAPSPYAAVIAEAQDFQRRAAMNTPEQIGRDVTATPPTDVLVPTGFGGSVSIPRAIAEPMATVGPRVALPIATAVGLGSGVGTLPTIGALLASGAAGEFLGQTAEKEFGARNEYGLAEGAFNAALTPVTVGPLRGISSPLVRMGVRGLEGAGLSAVQDVSTRAIRGDEQNFMETLRSAGFGAGIGGVLGAGELARGYTVAGRPSSGVFPSELSVVGQTLREPVLPAPTAVIPDELAVIRQAEAISGAEQAAILAGNERSVAALDEVVDAERVRKLGERMMGKSPQDQLSILDQEMRLQKDVLTKAEERAGLDTKILLKQQIEQQKALEKAAMDQQKAAADAQKAQVEASKPPEVPESVKILAEPITQKPSIANVATEVATQTEGSPFALQARLNQMTEAQGAVPEPVAAPEVPTTKAQAIKAAIADDTTKWQYTVFRPGEGYPSAIQVDAIQTTGNTVSSNPADLRKAGGDIPDVPDWVPQGQYSLEEIKAFIKQGEPNAIREQATAGRVLRGEAPQPELDVELRGVVGENQPEVAARPKLAGEAADQVRQRALQEPLKAPSSAEQRLNTAGADLPPVSSLTQAQKRAELEAAGVTTYKGKPVADLNPAELSNAVGKNRRGELGKEEIAFDTRSSRMRGERGAVPITVMAPLAGAASGGGTGYLATSRREGESDEEFEARRLKATVAGAVLGAGSGVLAGGALSRGVKARAPVKPRAPGAPVDLPEVESGQGIRQTAEKVIENQSYPQQLRQTLADDPQIIYDKISRNQYRETVAGATDAELQQMLTSGDPLLKISAQAEIGSRMAVTPGMENEGARVIAEFSKNFTSPAQILGLAGLIRSPQAMVKAVEDTLRLSVGKGKPLPTMTPAVQKKLFELSSDNIKAEMRYSQAERAARRDYSPATRDEFLAAQKLLGESKKKLADYTKDILPERYGQIVSKIIKGNLLAPLSFAKNMFGNAAWQTLLRGSESLATGYDALYSGLAGKSRVMSLANPLPGKEELQALGDGIKIAGKELLTGPSSESYIKAEVQRGFHPLRAMLQSVSGIPVAERAMERAGIASLPRTPGGGVRVNDRAKKLIEATLGISPEMSFRFLNIGDRPVRYAVQQRILTEQANLKGLKGTEREKFMLLPDPETQKLMETESMGGILAQDNKAASKIGRLVDEGLVDIAETMGQGRPAWLEDANKVLGTLIIPYRQFPANFAITAANFALPPVGMARAWAQAAKGNQREALRNMGEATIGFMLLGAAGYLWDKGLISEPADPKDKKRRSAQYETMGSQRLNISGLERLQEGGDPTYRRGDHTVDWSTMGPAAASFYALTKMKSHDINKASRTGEIPNERGDFEAFLNVMDVAGFAFDQSFLSGTSAALDAFKDWENYGDRFLQNTFRAVTSIAAPNSLEAFNRTQYKFIPEQKGDTTTETLKNVWDYKTGQLDKEERQNYKRDLWGNPITRTPEGQNPYISQFIDVTKGERKAPDPFKQSLLELYQQTRSVDVYPPLVPRYVSNNGVTVELDADDYDALQDFTGQVRETLGRKVTSDPRFASQDVIPEAKIEYLNRVYSAGAKAGKAQLFAMAGFVDKYPELFDAPPKPGHKSRVVSRDAQARGRVRMSRESAP